MSGQTLTDRIAAAQYGLTGSDVARAVCKATTHEVMGPKKKHLEYLIHATNETNVNIPQMAETLFERATNASWVVVFKALITTHHIMLHGNERFIQYMASRGALFNVSNFIDKTGYDMSTFIRRYGRYLNEKAFAYRQMAYDFSRVKKGPEGVMRTLSTDKLLKGMPTLQDLIDVLLEFDVHPKELTNGVINAAFLLLFKDLVKLFACYNDGIINLLEKYFKMKKGDCKEALEIYRKFLTRMTRIAEFLKLAEQVGVDQNDIPDLTYAPTSVLDSLEVHLSSLETKKGEGSPAKASPTDNGSPISAPAKTADGTSCDDVTSQSAGGTTSSSDLLGLDLLGDTTQSAEGAPTAGPPSSWGDLLSEAVEAPALAPPPAAAAASVSTDTNLFGDPFAPSQGSAEVAPGLDLFATDTCTAAVAPSASTAVPAMPQAVSASPAIDLFGDAFSTPAPAAAAVTAAKSDSGAILDLFGGSFTGPSTEPQPAAPPASGSDMLAGFMSPSPAALAVTAAQNNMQPSLNTAFGSVPATAAPPSGLDASVFDGLGNLLAPALTPQGSGAPSMAGGGMAGAPPVKAIGGDLNSSLANLVGNLGMGTQTNSMQWTEKKMTGGASWQPQVAPTGWGAPGSSMPGPSLGVQGATPPFGMMAPPMGVQPGFGMAPPGPMMPQMFPQQQPMMMPQFPGPSATGVPVNPSPQTHPQMSPGVPQSPRKPPPPKDPLADLNIKDFM